MTSNPETGVLHFKVEEDDALFEANFQYKEDNIYLIDRNIEEDTPQKQVAYSIVDDYILTGVLDAIGKFYTVSPSKLNEEEYNHYGIALKYKDISFSGENMNLEGSYIEEFSVDLDKFENAISPLKGTYGTPDNNDVTIQIEPTVNFSLEKATNEEIVLNIQVKDLSLINEASAICEIYGMSHGTLGESQLIDEIPCVEGKNTYKISNLKPNTEYSYLVHMNYQWKNLDGDVFSGIVTANWQKFTTSNTENTINNPKTGMGYIYTMLIIFILSIIGILYFQKINKQNNII